MEVKHNMASLSSSNESNNKNEAPSEDDILNDEAEERHHLECNIAMLQYSIFMKTEIERRENHLKQISNVQKQYLPYEKMINDIKKLKQAVHANQVLLNNIADDSIYDKHREYLNANFVRCTSKPHQMSKVKTIIEQIVRDWSKEGEVERNECYLPIINELKKRLPIRNNTNNDNNSNVEEDCRVLIPGFGLARILVDIAALGYAVEGNEFDYFMIFASTYFLNGGLAPYSIDIFPYIHSPCNILSKDAHLLKPVKIPDLSTIDVLKENPNLKMRMCSGEFLHVYRNKEYIEHFDCITTCFFVDTAPNIIEYIQVSICILYAIHTLLRIVLYNAVLYIYIYI